MGQIDAGKLIAKALKNEGVECVFTLSGGHIMPILYACREEGIKVIDVRHECSAGYAADAYAKATGKPGVIVTTAGPGVINASTAMAEAAFSNSPIVHIGGASPVKENETGPLQDIGALNVMASLVKWARKIYDGHRAGEYVSMAFRQATSHTPGPVYIEIAMDVVNQKFDEETAVICEKAKAENVGFGDPSEIKKVAELLISAKRPAMVVGDSARYSNKYGEYVKLLAEYLDMPVLATEGCRGCFASDDHPLFLLGKGATMEADVILELGVRNDYKLGKARAPRFHKDAKVVQVNMDMNLIGYNRCADVAIVGSAGAVAKQLFEEISAKSKKIENSEWIKKATEIVDKMNIPYVEGFTSEINPIHPGRCAAEVAKFINTKANDWTLVCDGGDAATWMKNAAIATREGQVLCYGPLGTIGVGPGFTMGAWAANNKPVLYYTGDGSFGFYSMEFDTFARKGIPVVCVISNDSSWGMIKLSEGIKKADYIKEHGHLANELEFMRAYEEFPKVWGGLGIRVDKPEDIIPAIEKVYASGKPGIVNVCVDQEAMSPTTAAFSGVKK